MTETRTSCTLAAAAAILLLGVAYGADGGRPYSAGPLREPLRDEAENLAEFTRFNNWLNEKLASTPPERMPAVREHLYTIIDSQARSLHARNGSTCPAGKDVILSTCFAWATRMKVPGAELALAALDPETAKKFKPLVRPPDSLKLALRKDLFELSSTLGPWSVRFPYQFMIGNLGDFTAKDGLRTQVVVVSTGFGRHTGIEGSSQATIMLVYSPEGTSPAFESFWLKNLEMTEAEKVTEKGQPGPVYRRMDPATRVRAEARFPSVKKGAMCVAYLGVDGTYQWNREHFQDFLSNLRLEQ